MSSWFNETSSNCIKSQQKNGETLQCMLYYCMCSTLHINKSRNVKSMLSIVISLFPINKDPLPPFLLLSLFLLYTVTKKNYLAYLAETYTQTN